MTHLQIIFFTIGLVALVLLAAFFSCAETALLTVNRYRLRHQARAKRHYAIRLLNWLKRPDQLLATILIGNTFANMLASSLATLLAYHFWGEHGALLAAIVLTIVVLIFAEITPKTVAALYPDKLARWFVLPVGLLMTLFFPIVWFSNLLTNSLLRLFRIHVKQSTAEPLTREELRSIVYDTTGKISRQYQNMLLGILDLNQLTVDDVMTPRHEVIMLDTTLPLETIQKQLARIESESIPVCQGHTDRILGVLMLHDVLKLLLSQQNISKKNIAALLVDPYFVPSGTTLAIQLAYFQQNEDAFAFVVDEYGEVQGVLTLNDILEEILGDVTYLTENKWIQQQVDGSYMVDGSVLVREFNRVTGWALPQDGPRTITGLIVEYLEMLPRAGLSVLIAHHPIEIMQTKENRVKLARIFPRLETMRE